MGEKEEELLAKINMQIEDLFAAYTKMAKALSAYELWEGTMIIEGNDAFWTSLSDKQAALLISAQTLRNEAFQAGLTLGDLWK